MKFDSFYESMTSQVIYCVAYFKPVTKIKNKNNCVFKNTVVSQTAHMSDRK